MARQREKIYKRRRPLRTLLYTLGISVLTVAVLLVVVFFGAQRYIVHTLDGIRLDIPFLQDILDDIPPDAQREPFLPPESEPISPPPGTSPGETEAEEEPEAPIHTAFISGDTLAGVLDWEFALLSIGANAMLVTVSDETGHLWWESDVETAIRYGLAGEGQIALTLRSVGQDTRRSALLFGFQNQLMAQRNPPTALQTGWLDPENEEIRAYIIDLAVELAQNGFTEIVLAGFSYPSGLPAHQLPADYSAIILSFLAELYQALSPYGAELSLMTQEEHWRDPEGGPPLPLYPNLRVLSRVITRFYCILSPETAEDAERLSALTAAATAILGENTPQRFIPGGVYYIPPPDESSWIIPANLGTLP